MPLIQIQQLKLLKLTLELNIGRLMEPLKIGLLLTGLLNMEDPLPVESRVLHLPLLTVLQLERQLMDLVPPLLDLPPMDLEMDPQFR